MDVRQLFFFVFLSCFFSTVFSGESNELNSPESALPVPKAGSARLDLSYEDVAHIPYERPKAFDWLTESPGNLMLYAKRIRPKENAWWLAGIGLSTALLIKYDQQIMDESQRFARKLGLISDTKHGRETYTLLDWSIGEYPIPFVVPRNANSVMYFIGDGIPQIAIVGGLSWYGVANDDNKALSTASQVMESLFVTGIIVQAIKRSTGRESGFRATQDGGKWQFFPNQIAYTKNVPKYDAFPSGHLATVMASTTVLAENYADHTYIRPVGYTLMGLLSFAMLNNGVHWAGDYPLGLAIGYTAARVAIERNRKQRWLKSRALSGSGTTNSSTAGTVSKVGAVKSADSVKALKKNRFNAVFPFSRNDALGLTYFSNF